MVATQTALDQMPSVTAANYVLLHKASWETYESLLADYHDQAGPRLAYDNGVLEIKMPSINHEISNRTLAQLVEILVEESDLDLLRMGSTTFLRKDLLKGVEPDSCFYIQHAEKVRGKDKIDLLNDPPPDLVIEVDVTSGSLNKFPIFAALQIPEIWRCKGEHVTIYKLEGEDYWEAERSLALPILTDEMATRFLAESGEMKSSVWARHVRQWVREQLDAQQQPQS